METVALLKAKIDELQGDVVRLRSELAVTETELRDLQTAIRVLEKYGDAADVAPRISPDQARMLPDVADLTLADAAVEMLRFFGGRAQSGEIRHALIDSGKLPPSKDSYGYLLKVMREKPDRFVKVEQGTWALPEE